MSRTYNLYQLQLIDNNIDKANQRLKEIKGIIEDDSDVTEAYNALKAAEDKNHLAQQSLRQAEFNVKEQKLKIEQTEATLYSGRVTNPRELQALQDEAESLKRYLTVLEDRQLEAMLALDDANNALKEKQAHYQKVENERKTLLAKLNEETEALNQQLSLLKQERESITARIDSPDLELYNSLRRDRDGIAVARVVDKACEGCGTTLSAALYQASRSPDKLETCNSCKRILYNPD